MFTTGFAITVTDRVALPVQPAVLVPVTVYTVLVAGDTAIDVLDDPVSQLYVFAPLAVRLIV
jgi:hypothetical protein